MMTGVFRCMTTIALMISLLVGAPETPPDSARLFPMTEQVVTGQRLPVDVSRLPSPVQTADSQLIAAAGIRTAAEAAGLASGTLLRSYGGGGALRSVSLRGLAPEYSLVLLDGFRYTSFQIGTVDLGLVSVNDIDRVETAPGGGSAVYGADAVGGVINIITRRPARAFGAETGAGFGSSGMEHWSASVTAGGTDGSLRVSAERERASNRYPFVYDDGAVRMTLERSGADYVSAAGSVMAAIQTGGSEFRLHLRASDADRGQPTTVSGPVQDNRARLHDADRFVSLRGAVPAGESFALSAGLAYRNNRQSYLDPRIGLDAWYENDQLQFVHQTDIVVAEGHSVAAGFDLIIASIASSEVHASRRRQFSIFAASSHRPFREVDLALYPALRYDSYSDIAGGVSPRLGINAAVPWLPMLRVRGTAGRNYRVPTFNDLYWIQGGNPSLRPERAFSADAGVTAMTEWHGLYTAEATWFTVRTTDKIVWQPVSSSLWSPKNLSEVASSGTELRFSAELFERAVMVRYSHQFTSATVVKGGSVNDPSEGKQLPYTPKENSAVTASFTGGGASFSIIHTFTGYRFETAENDPRFVLSSHSVTDLHLTYTYSMSAGSIVLSGGVTNLFGTEYTIITGYPMPLRQYRCSVRFIH